MNKTRLFGLVAVIVALMTFTGCDDILEAFYPEFGDKFGGEGNSIGIYVEVEVPGSDIVNPQIAVVVERLGNREWVQQAFVWPFWNWNSAGNVILSAYVDLYGIPDGEYKVIVWLERTENSNGYPDFDEPSRDAVWYYSGGPEQGDGVFRFPNDKTGNRIEGEAILKIFQGAAINRDFYLDGDQVISAADLLYYDPDSRDYAIVPANSELRVRDFYWDLSGPSYAFGNGIVSQGEDATFTINYAGLQQGYYWLYVEITYTDDWWESKWFPVRIVETEAPDLLTYYARVSVNYAGNWPLNLAMNDEVQYEYIIRDASGASSTYSGSATVFDGATNGLNFDFTTVSLTYDPTSFEDGDDVDTLIVNLKVNRGGDFFDEYYIEYPLSVSTLHDGVALNGTLDIPIDGFFFRQVFLP